MRGFGQPQNEELYVNCLEDASSYINYESAEGESFDEDIYENDKRYSSLMYVNGVSIAAEVYVKESPTGYDGYLNVGSCGKNSSYEGDYVYAQNVPHAHNRSPKIARRSSLSPTGVEKDLGKSDVGIERPFSRSGAVKRHLFNFNDEDEHDAKNIYEKNGYDLMVSSVKLTDEGTNKANCEDYVRMHASTDEHEDNGEYVTANQGQGMANDRHLEGDQLYANTQKCNSDEDESFYVNIPK